MSNEKQTAVDLLIEQIVNRQNGHGNSKSLDEIFIQAKAIEKQQIVEAYVEGCKDTYGQKEPLKRFSDEHVAECYYSQTYKQS